MFRLIWPLLLSLVLLLLGACRTDPEPIDRAYVVGGAWVVILTDDWVCFQDDLYAVPDMDEPKEAIAACKARRPTSS